MINGVEVLAQALAGYNPGPWRIYRAQKNHFVTETLVGIFLTALFLGGVVWILSQNQFVITPGYGSGGTLDEGTFNTWRAIDIIAGIAFAIAMAYYTFKTANNIGKADTMALVLMPEGLVMGKGKPDPTVVSYGALKGLKATIYRGGTINLSIKDAQTGKNSLVRIDGRYGRVRPLANQIVADYNNYHQYLRNMQQQQQYPPQPQYPQQ